MPVNTICALLYNMSQITRNMTIEKRKTNNNKKMNPQKDRAQGITNKIEKPTSSST
jgi:hypothetical protein